MRSLWLAVAVFVLLPITESPAKTQAVAVASTPTPTKIPVPSPTTTPTPLPRPTPPPVVLYEKLLPFLPPTPAGWTAEKPSGSTNEIEVFNLSTATQTYQHGDEDSSPVVTVTLIDAGGHKGYFETTTGRWRINAETPDGYDKTVEIDGVPGYEHYSKEAKSGSLSVIVAQRYFVQIEVTNQDPKELREWLKKIDLKKLGELK